MSIVFLRLSSVAKSSSLQRRLINCLLVALFGFMIMFSLSNSFVSCSRTWFLLDLSLLSLSCCLVSKGSIFLSFCILLLALISVHSNISVMVNLKFFLVRGIWSECVTKSLLISISLVPDFISFQKLGSSRRWLKMVLSVIK